MMLTRQLIFRRSTKCVPEALNICRLSHKLSRHLPISNVLKQPVKPIVYRSIRQASTNSGVKKTLPLIIGISTVGGAIVAYNVLRKKESPAKETDEDEFEDKPFVQEHLQEDLALLEEFGPIPYLLIGAGSASYAAYRAIRTKDPTAKVLMIGDEAFLPYMRPPLSKEMWFAKDPNVAETLSFTQWDGKSRSIFYEHPSFYFSMKELLDNKNGGISVIRGKKVVKIDPAAQVVYLDKGEKISYKKCLVATGAKPKNLPLFENADNSVKKHVTLFRTIRDFQKLEKIVKKNDSVVIVGGGFLGSELACGIAYKRGPSGLKVTQLFPETGNLGKVLPEYLSIWISKKMEKEGVKIIPEVDVKAVSMKGKQVELLLSNDQAVTADHIIVAVGADPNTEFAKASGLEVDPVHGGFVVNTEMEARKNLWIAGDVSCFYDVNLGRRRIEHHDHAVVSGRLAGENMAGESKPYWHQSMFWSDLGPEISFEAIGVVDSSLPTVGVFTKPDEKEESKLIVDGSEKADDSKTEEKSEIKADTAPRAPNISDNYGKGIIFYLREDTIVGIALWNVLGKMQIARQIINESKSQDDISEIAKLFDLYTTEESSA
ncbi:apoptosis-inducing factor 1, mitochondrial-like [Argiope bruennichi]|uniref:Apoptosis-inducing factor 1 like protein n=1 Tax=Argiope bruennichi TaxID=94029 RepID=A0A8T0FA00_ARGBR|nr:apoptosis-inducing factor 1, mitochondrial-like [Argiope bruennichi]KAF8788067.1 Apoptosis-inducing factor 1 like protein [Argiope bruennichi]